MLNKVLLIGRLTAKPELRYTSNNKAYTRVCVAVNRYNEGTDFINVTIWNKSAEHVCEYLDKGSMVLIEGSISVNNYEDSEANKRVSVEVMAQNVQFLDKKGSNQTTEETVEETVTSDENPFEEYGDKVVIDDNFLDD